MTASDTITNRADTDTQARVLALLAREGRPMTAAAIIHQIGTSAAFLAKMQQNGALELVDHGRRLRLRPPSSPRGRRQSRRPAAWEAQADSAKAAARRRRGKSHPATLQDLIRAAANARVPVTQLPAGHHLGHRVRWLETGIAPAPKKPKKPRARPASQGNG